MKEVTRFPDRKMVKQLLSWFRQHVIRAKTRSRMTTATTFSRQNDAASRASTTWYWENLVVVLVLVLVLESKGLYCRVMRDDIKHPVQIWYYGKAGPSQTADNDYCTTPKKRMTNWNTILFLLSPSSLRMHFSLFHTTLVNSGSWTTLNGQSSVFSNRIKLSRLLILLSRERISNVPPRGNGTIGFLVPILFGQISTTCYFQSQKRGNFEKKLLHAV